MKQFFHTLKLLAVSIFLATSATSCNDSEDEPKDPKWDIVGTWKTDSYDAGEDWDCYVFREDGTGIGVEHVNNLFGNADYWEFTYVYDPSGKTITMTCRDEDKYTYETEVFTITNINDYYLSFKDENNDNCDLAKCDYPLLTYHSECSGLTEDWLGDIVTHSCSSQANNYVVDIYPYYLWHNGYQSVTVTAIPQVDSWYSDVSVNISNTFPRKMTISVDKNTSTTSKKYYCLDIKLSTDNSEFTGLFFLHQEAATSSSGSSSGSSSSGGSSSGSNSSTEAQWGKVKVNIVAYSGYSGDSYVNWVDGQTDTVDYVYYPSTGKYYIYGGIFCSNNSANGGKGIRYEAKKGYNSIRIDGGADYYYIGTRRINYTWEVYMRATIP